MRRQLVLKGLLPMVVVALALSIMLGVQHMRAIDAESQAVARIQSMRIGSSLEGWSGDDALRNALASALSRSPSTRLAILHRDDAPDLVVDSGRRFDEARALRLLVNTSKGNLETVSDGSAAHERRVAGLLMTLLLCAGVMIVFAFARRAIEREVVAPVERVRSRIDRFLHPRGTHVAPDADEWHQIDALLDELVELRARHDAALADALRQRLQDIARHTRFVEQVGDHFRQPLQALSLFVAGMQPGEDLRQRAVLGQMRSSLTRLGELLDGLLEMARFDAGAVEPATVDLIASDLFVRGRAGIEADAARLGVDVRWRGGRLPIRTDPTLFGELLHRLVANAVLSTPHGRVLVALRRRGDAIRLEVRDNGMGLEPGLETRVFEEFTRLPGHPGYGLGLAVARRIADTLGGRIGVRSSPGRGSLFWAEFDAMAIGASARTAAALSRHPAI
ncbi:HAMP domain-containing sensor histidine kinase [Luteibacter sp. 329MFSha]|uniref:sensor histidine kinase n=1 Tax=Luteibacter sp. 329MFSha TaxID=1798239 RepID=UPI000B7EACCE|nr:HAMP domain-containing sensor histidine kinase [Luteibacter sp. 329MFSha]